jgi:hypothetical protein
MAKDIPRMSVLRRHLSPFAPFIVIAVVVLMTGIAIFVGPVIGKNAADRSEHAELARSDAVPGIFRPTKEQWAGFKIEPVGLLSFRPEQVTEGNIAIDDDRTTPVYSPYSGRVIKLIAKLGDHVEPGVPPYEGDPVRVWVAGECGTIAGRSVRVGQIADGPVEILAGLSQGE